MVQGLVGVRRLTVGVVCVYDWKSVEMECMKKNVDTYVYFVKVFQLIKLKIKRINI